MKRKAKLGIIGVGGRSWALIESANSTPDCEVTAICDLRQDRLDEKLKMFRDAGMKKPRTYLDYHELLADPNVNCIISPTSWNDHLPIAIEAMKAGKRVAIEVAGAPSLDILWQTVHTSEETGIPCMLLENCCYGRNAMLVMNLARQGLLGELIYCECGYEHYIGQISVMADRLDRTWHNAKRNGDLYPTHGIGPVAKILDINRGNRFLTISSIASKARGFDAYAAEHDYKGCGSIRKFNKGDVVTSIIKCANGETITLVHNISLPRPYSLHFRVEGTGGIWEESNGIYIEKMHGIKKHDPKGFDYIERKWHKIDELYKKYDHPLWKEWNGQFKGGHEGIDEMCVKAFLHSVATETDPPIDVYDLATWMSITCLSEESVAMGGMPVPFPDFTNGKWVLRKPEPESKWMLSKVFQDKQEKRIGKTKNKK